MLNKIKPYLLFAVSALTLLLLTGLAVLHYGISDVDETVSDITQTTYWNRGTGNKEMKNKQKAEQPVPQSQELVQETKTLREDNARCCVVYSKNYLINLMGLEKLHPFDIHKYKKIKDQLVTEKLITEEEIFHPEPISDDDILLAQKKELLTNLKNKTELTRYLEAPQMMFLPLSIIDKGVLRPFRYTTGGTLLASRLALTSGIGINVGGGYHHAMPTKGEGFCIFADVPIAIRKLQSEKMIERALVIDVDAHQGNGTAVCLADDDQTFTFSMHQGDIYPTPKEKSDWDIELEGGTNDQQYLKILEEALPKMFEKSKPNIVFIVGGCDPLKGDPLAGLEMTNDGIVKRDAMIVAACIERGVPVVLTLSGGYSDDAWRSQYMSIKNLIETYKLGNTK